MDQHVISIFAMTIATFSVASALSLKDPGIADLDERVMLEA
jgi:hypothetical protein